MPVWIPVYRYKAVDKHGHTSERPLPLHDFPLDECPVSFITAESVQMVRMWRKARRLKSTMFRVLGQQDAWIEDVEELLRDAEDHIQATYERKRDERLTTL